MGQILVNIRMDEELKKKYGADMSGAWDEFDYCVYHICKKDDKGKKDSV